MSTDAKMVNFSKPTPDFNRKFFDLYSTKSMVDVTLSADGQFLYAHKLVLGVASSWFEELFKNLPKEKEPVIVLKDVSITLLNSIIEFIYLGTTDIHEDETSCFKTALDALRISLDEDESMDDGSEVINESHELNQNEDDKCEDEEQFEAFQQVKSETDWNNVVVKEEPVEHQAINEEQPKPIMGSLKSPFRLPSSIQLKPTTPKIQSFGSLITKNSPPTSSPVIRIRTPASINEKVNEPATKTLKLVQRLPTLTRQNSSTSHNIQELSKRLSKAILIRRVKKSDGSFVSERAPIKIVQGVNIQRIKKPPAQMTVKSIRTILPNEKKVLPIFRCTHCTKAFSVNKRRNAHEKFCFKNPSRPSSQCPYCPMVLCNPMYIATHVRKVHSVDEHGKSIVDNENSN